MASDAENVVKFCETELSPFGFECHSFKINWYNEKVDPVFRIEAEDETLAVLVISKPSMFRKFFMPWLLEQNDPSTTQDPLDQSIKFIIDQTIQAMPKGTNCEIIYDYEMAGRRPKICMQVVAHVTGAAFYYQRSELAAGNDPWPPARRIFGVCLHEKFGGWFAMRAVLIFRGVKYPDHWPKSRIPAKLLTTDQAIIDLLEKFNGDWRNNQYRDVLPVLEKYDDQQIEYFSTLPGDRHELIRRWIADEKR